MRPSAFVAGLALIAACGVARGGGTCGDGLCGRGEETGSCRRDCGVPVVVAGSETVVGRGPDIRAIRVEGQLLAGTVSPRNGRVRLTVGRLGDLTAGDGGGAVVAERVADGAGHLGNVNLFAFPGGKRLLVAFRDHGGAGAEGPFRLRVAFSDDGGATWRTGATPGDGLIERSDRGVWEPFLFQDARGGLRVVYARERMGRECAGSRGRPQDIVMRASEDGGHTWGAPEVVASEGVSRDGVPSVVRLRDGSYLLVFESWRNATCGAADPSLVIRAMQSRDGIVWERRRLVYAPAGTGDAGRRVGERASWPFVTLLPDGRAAVTFTSDEGRHRGRTPGEKEHNFDVWLMLSKGGASFDFLEWETGARTRVFEFQPGSERRNRFASSVVAGEDELLVFTGIPERYRRVRLEH